jgi:hypothetical protein
MTREEQFRKNNKLIAITVAVLDYVSAEVRERYV